MGGEKLEKNFPEKLLCLKFNQLLLFGGEKK